MTGDYFPVMPNLGWFIAGIFIGRTLYNKQKTLFPKVNTHFILIRVFSFIGRHSLIIYLLHQPLISAIVGIIGEIVN
jgi:uncharacterized membrane protein